MSKFVENKIVTRLVQSDGFDGYYALPKHIQRSTHFVSKVTHLPVELTQADKSVLFYMIEKVGFHNSGERQMFESMVHIASELCVSDKTVSRSVKKLIEHRVLIGSVVSKAIGYVYTDVDVNQTFTKTISDDQQNKMKPNPINVPASERKPVVTAPVATQEAFAAPTPDDGMPEHLNVPVLDYSDTQSQMEAFEVEDEFLKSLGY